jgi:hypothetical protein
VTGKAFSSQTRENTLGPWIKIRVLSLASKKKKKKQVFLEESDFRSLLSKNMASLGYGFEIHEHYVAHPFLFIPASVMTSVSLSALNNKPMNMHKIIPHGNKACQSNTILVKAQTPSTTAPRIVL